jgi:hypothetical protein
MISAPEMSMILFIVVPLGPSKAKIFSKGQVIVSSTYIYIYIYIYILRRHIYFSICDVYIYTFIYVCIYIYVKLRYSPKGKS